MRHQILALAAVTASLLLLLLLTAFSQTSLDYRGFAVDSNDWVYVGFPSRIDVYESNGRLSHTLFYRQLSRSYTTPTLSTFPTAPHAKAILWTEHWWKVLKVTNLIPTTSFKNAANTHLHLTTTPTASVGWGVSLLLEILRTSSGKKLLCPVLSAAPSSDFSPAGFFCWHIPSFPIMMLGSGQFTAKWSIQSCIRFQQEKHRTI